MTTSSPSRDLAEEVFGPASLDRPGPRRRPAPSRSSTGSRVSSPPPSTPPKPTGPGRRAARPTRAGRRPGDRQRLADRGRGRPRDGARRAVPGDVGAGDDLGRHPRHRTLPRPVVYQDVPEALLPPSSGPRARLSRRPNPTIDGAVSERTPHVDRRRPRECPVGRTPADRRRRRRSTVDRIAHLKLSSITLPLATPISDAKVLTGRQKPMTEVAFLFVEVTTADGHAGHRLLLLQAGRRTGPVRARPGDRAGR